MILSPKTRRETLNLTLLFIKDRLRLTADGADVIVRLRAQIADVLVTSNAARKDLLARRVDILVLSVEDLLQQYGVPAFLIRKLVDLLRRFF